MSWRDLTDQVMKQCRDTFGEPATYTPDGGSPIEITAIIDEAFESVDPNTGVAVISQQPMIGVRTADLPAVPTERDLVTMRGRDFRVIEWQTDGQAGYKILLHKAAT